jgi:hypothetical protein
MTGNPEGTGLNFLFADDSLITSFFCILTLPFV